VSNPGAEEHMSNYDPDIVPLLDAPIEAEFERSEEGRFVAVDSDH
jgi:hypothetical protein